MVSGEKRIRAEFVETVGDDRASGLFREPLAPKFKTKMKT
jgi:hypothetical protein